MYITDYDIENLMFNHDVREFLEYITEKDINQKLIINFILFIFCSKYIDKNIYYIDWIKEIISVLEKNQFNIKMLTPRLKQINEINFIFKDVVKKMYDLNNFGEIIINDICVSYDMFNDYINILYEWFKENYQFQ